MRNTRAQCVKLRGSGHIMQFVLGRACLWGPERYGAILVLLSVPIIGAVFAILGTIARRKSNKTCLAMVSILGGFCMAAWIQFFPCLFMICDGGHHDNPGLRFVLQFTTGPICAVACFSLCGGRKPKETHVACGVPVVEAV